MNDTPINEPSPDDAPRPSPGPNIESPPPAAPAAASPAISPAAQQLLGQLKEQFTDPAKHEMLAGIAVDSLAVGALALLDPEQAERDGRHLASQLSGLTATEAMAAGSTILLFVQQSLTAALTGALAASRAG